MDGFKISSDIVTLRKNAADGNGEYGFVIQVNQGIVINNSADANQGDPAIHDGIGFVFDGGTITARGNSSTNNVGDGFQLNTDGGTFVNNTATGNGGDGFHLVDSAANTLSLDTSESNGNDGFDLDAESVANVLNNNTAVLNAVFDSSDDSTGTGTAGTANTWTNNTANTSNPAGLA